MRIEKLLGMTLFALIVCSNLGCELTEHTSDRDADTAATENNEGDEEQRWVFYDKAGKRVGPSDIDYVDDDESDRSKFILVGRKGLYGYMKQDGSLLTQIKYDEAYAFSNERGLVRVDGKYGYLDENGKLAIPATYDDAFDFSDGLALVEKDKKLGFIDKSGKMVIPCDYESSSSFNGGVALVSKNDRIFAIDKTGKEIFAHKEDDNAIDWRAFPSGLTAVANPADDNQTDKDQNNQ